MKGEVYDAGEIMSAFVVGHSVISGVQRGELVSYTNRLPIIALLSFTLLLLY